MSVEPEVAAQIDRLTKTYADELTAFRRDLHAHPELGREEVRTTRVVRDRLRLAGLETTGPLSDSPGEDAGEGPGSGLLCDIAPPDASGPVVALRADLDALPVPDGKDVAYRSTRDGVAHACGHDVHTSIVLGAGLVLGDLAAAGLLDRRVRLIFQPAEEVIPGGALDVLAADGLAGVGQIYSLHCDPRIEVGQVGLRSGPLTAAVDRVHARLAGPGGHTARPHLTVDLAQALGALVSDLPAMLSRRVDPRAGLTLVWGRIRAGEAANAIPSRAEAEGTLRILDAAAWKACEELVPELARAIVEPYGAELEFDVHHGVPPVVNDPDATGVLAEAVGTLLGPGAVTTTAQSMGGEDFAWYLTRVPGAMARLGVCPAGAVGPTDLHRGTFDVDEHAIGVGVRMLAGAALTAPVTPTGGR